MNTRTTFSIEPLQKRFDHKNKMIALGSCFAENIGQKLRAAKFPILVNPWGTLFNPYSIAACLDSVGSDIDSNNEKIIHSHGSFLHYDYHSRIRGSSKEELVVIINQNNRAIAAHLATCKLAIITLGTALVYRSGYTGNIVANCHKQPSTSFVKEFLSPQVIHESMASISTKLREFSPDISIIWTISPIRHIKDGIPTSSRSKALLLSTLHEYLTKEKDQYYFPAYEWQMDDLRDYRYYAEDMVHPTEQAISYIWKHFMTYALTEKSQGIIGDIEKIHTALQHRPFVPSSKEHEQFLKATKNRIKQLQKITQLPLTEEMDQIDERLTQVFE